jgi:hypothetical protein
MNTRIDGRTVRLRPPDVLIRDGHLYFPVLGNTGPALLRDELVSASALLRRYHLAAPIVITRWVKAGLPHHVIAGRRLFRLGEVECWLEEKGYDPRALEAGKGLLLARRREGRQRWRKGQMKSREQTSEAKR